MCMCEFGNNVLYTITMCISNIFEIFYITCMNVSMWHTFQFVLKSVCLDFFIVSVTVYFWLLIFMCTPVRYVIGIFNKCKKHEIGKNNKEKNKKKKSRIYVYALSVSTVYFLHYL